MKNRKIFEKLDVLLLFVIICLCISCTDGQETTVDKCLSLDNQSIRFDIPLNTITTRSSSDISAVQVMGYIYDGGAAKIDKSIYLGSDGISTYSPVNLVYDGKKWDYNTATDMVYWPNKALNFYATANLDYSLSKIENINGNVTIKFGIPSDITKQKDVLMAQCYNMTKAVNNGIVKLNFYHYLNKIIFKGYLGSPNYEVEIKDIIVHNVGDSVVYRPQYERSLGIYKDSVYVFPSLGSVKSFSLNMKNPVKVLTADKDNPVLLSSYPLYLPLGAANSPWSEKETIEDANKNKHCYLEIIYRFKDNGKQIIPSSGNGYGSTYVPFVLNEKKNGASQIIVNLRLSSGFDEYHKPIRNIKSPISFTINIEDWTNEKIDFKSFKKP